jgi:putative ABC transport system permease protein
MFSELWRRLEFLLRRRRFEEDLAEEMRLHLDLRTAEKGSETGARVRFGNESILRERSREAWGWTFAETLWQDIRYAARDLNSSRGRRSQYCHFQHPERCDAEGVAGGRSCSIGTN